MGPPAGLRPAEGPIFSFSRLESGRNPARASEVNSGPGPGVHICFHFGFGPLGSCLFALGFHYAQVGSVEPQLIEPTCRAVWATDVTKHYLS